MQANDLEHLLSGLRAAPRSGLYGRRVISVDPGHAVEAIAGVKPGEVIVVDEPHSHPWWRTFARRNFRNIHRAKIDTLGKAMQAQTPEWEYRKTLYQELAEERAKDRTQGGDGFLEVVGYSRKPIGEAASTQLISLNDVVRGILLFMESEVIKDRDRRITVKRYPPALDRSRRAIDMARYEGVNFTAEVPPLEPEGTKHEAITFRHVPVVANKERFGIIRQLVLPAVGTHWEEYMHLGFTDPATNKTEIQFVRPEVIGAYAKFQAEEQELYRIRHGEGHVRYRKGGIPIRACATVELNPFPNISQEGLDFYVKMMLNTVVRTWKRDLHGDIVQRRDGTGPRLGAYHSPTWLDSSLFLMNAAAQEPDYFFIRKKRMVDLKVPDRAYVDFHLTRIS